MSDKLLFEANFEKRKITQIVSVALNSILGLGLFYLAWKNENAFYLVVAFLFTLLVIYLLMDKPEGRRTIKLFEDRLVLPVGFRLKRELEIPLSRVVDFEERYIKGTSYIQMTIPNHRSLFISEVMMEEKKYYELLSLLKKDQSINLDPSLESKRVRRKKWEKMMFWYGAVGGVFILALIQSASAKSYLFTNYFGYGILASFCSIMVFRRFLPESADILAQRERFRVYLINFCIYSVFFTYLFMAF